MGGIPLDGSAHPHPLEHAIPGVPWRAPYQHLRAEPQPFGARPINAPISLTEAPGRALSTPDNRNGRLTENKRRFATADARTVSPEHNLRPWAHASRALEGTCETWAHSRAPGERLTTTGATPLRPERNL